MTTTIINIDPRKMAINLKVYTPVTDGSGQNYGPTLSRTRYLPSDDGVTLEPGVPTQVTDEFWAAWLAQHPNDPLRNVIVQAETGGA